MAKTKDRPGRVSKPAQKGSRVPLPPLYAMDETAAALGTSVSNIRFLVREGKLTPVARVGKRQWQLFLQADVHALRDARRKLAERRRQLLDQA